MKTRIFFSLLAIIVGLTDPAFAQANNGCPTGYTKVGEKTEETETAIIVHPICERVQAPGANSAANFCKVKKLVSKDIEAIKAIDFHADIVQYEEFEKLSNNQKAAFERKALSAAIDQGLEMAEKGVGAAASLNPWNVNKTIDKFKEKGFNNEKLFSAMRAVAATKDKNDKAEAYKVFVKLAKAGYEGYETGKAMHEEPDNAKLAFLLGALKVMQNNPELGLAVTTTEFSESLAWIYYINRLQNERMTITDTELRNLSQLGANLKRHMAAMQQARADWNRQTGKTGEPLCTS